MKARDAAGNTSVASGAASATTWVFADGFETGNFSRWTSSTGIAAQTVEKFSGTYGAEAAIQKGNAVEYAVKALPGTYTDLYYDVRFKLLNGKTQNTDFLRFQTAAGANILALYYSDKKQLAYQNDVRNRRYGEHRERAGRRLAGGPGAGPDQRHEQPGGRLVQRCRGAGPHQGRQPRHQPRREGHRG